MGELAKRGGGPLSWLASRSWRFWAVVTLLTPIAYAASMGPAMLLGKQLPFLTFLFANTVYEPLESLADDSQTVRMALKWYVGLWTDNIPVFLNR